MTDDRQLTARSRRAFLTLGAGAAAGFGGWHWLRAHAEGELLSPPLRRVLDANGRVAQSYFSEAHRAPEFPRQSANQDTRVNGVIGLSDGFDPTQWKLTAGARQFTLADIQQLPRVEQTTELNCIEGWTEVVHWTGVRFKDFTRRYLPDEFGRAKYVHLATPDQAYYVGLDAESAFHPQTLLCFEMNGQPLTLEHGAPLRLVIPVKYGVKNLKRIGQIRYSVDRPPDYWAEQGYDWYAGL